MVSSISSHTNATSIGWHLWEIDLPLGHLQGGTWSVGGEAVGRVSAFRELAFLVGSFTDALVGPGPVQLVRLVDLLSAIRR